MNRSQTLDRLNRALQRQSPQHGEARRVTAQRTTRDTHPTSGSEALLQAANSGGVSRSVTSLNGDGGERLFCFGVPGFGWGAGELSGLTD